VLLLLAVGCSKKVTSFTEYQKPVKKEPVYALEKVEIAKPAIEKQVVAKSKIVVYFEFDSYIIDGNEKEKLNEAKGIVEIIGASCPIGTDEYNYGLGLKRANAVRVIVEKNGATVKSLRSVGENDLVTTDKNEYKLNRRCELIYEQ
jgi:outer membrane protein OmpA-like peptidoglycan-associated protein